MAVQKSLRIQYQAKKNQTGLTDVKAQIYLNGVAKAVGGSAVALTEIDATNAPGMYLLTLSGATLTGYGVATGQENTIHGEIDSASLSAPAPFRVDVNKADLDDLDIKLGTPAGASVSADIAAVKTDTAAIKTDLETGASSLASILTAIQAIQNNAGFSVPVPAQLIVPSSGSNLYRIPVTLYNSTNALVDADTQTVTVHLANQAGTSRDSYLGSTTMVRDSLGQYHVDVTIAAAAPIEELLFTFTYSIGGAATARKSVTETAAEAASSGTALQSTLLDVQGDVDNVESIVASGTFGNAAIKTAVDAIQSDLTNNVEGTGFVNSTDSLHAISVFLSANIFQGGRAV